ncbi:MAG: glycosyltransferase family 4 protein [Chloroflexota bacterium]
MRILMANSFYYLRGGVERCFFDLAALLEAHGHTVIPFCMQHERNLPSPYASYFVSPIDFPALMQRRADPRAGLQAMERVLYSREAQRSIARLIEDTRPDLVHIQEIDQEISPSILDTVKGRFGLPVVMTLHDYKMVCPNTNFIARGQVCERCSGGRFYQAVLQRCKRGALLPSLLAALEAYFQRLSRIYIKNVDAFLCPSRFLQAKLQEHGFPAAAHHLPTFVPLERFTPAAQRSGEMLFFGRLVALKGLRTLFDAVRLVGPRARLLLAGEGELRPELESYVRRWGLKQVHMLGQLDTAALALLVQSAAFTVFPSECYENYPLAVLESFAGATPVIGSNLGGAAELIRPGESGLLFQPGSAADLAEKIAYLLDNPAEAERMGRAARRQVEEENDPERYYTRLMEIYQSVREAV